MADGPRLVPFTPAPRPATSDLVEPIQLLEEMLAQLRAGRWEPSALIVVDVRRVGAGFTVGSTCAGEMTVAECYFWLDMARQQVLRETET